MNRSSSRKDLRTERRGVTPYTRTPLKHSTSWNPLASLRSFAQSFVGRNEDDISISGSEDEWDGKVPEVMQGEDIFSLAAAAGRGGPDFEERSKTWREGKANLRSRPAAKSNWGALGLSDADKQLRSSPSMPALRGLGGPKGLLPPPRDIRPSGSTLALRRFMEDKGVRFEPQDAEVLEGLARSLRTEPTESRPQQLGGWSAGSPIKSQTAPPKAHEIPSTPGSVFSLGSNAPLRPRSVAQRKITYLGPGMSPRRLNRDTKPARKPILDNLEYAKKRKVDDAMEVEPVATTPEVAAAASIAAAFNAKRKASTLPVRPSPLAQAPRQSPPKKRGDDLLRDLIDETLGPEASSKPSLVINPYEDLTPAPNGKVPALRSSLRQSSSSLKISMRGSASRGAAEKLANVGNSTRKMSTLEMVAGYTSSRDTPVSASPEPVIPNPGSALKASTFSAPAPKAAPAAVSKVPEPVAFQPLPVPSLSSSTIKSKPRPVMKDQPMPSAVAEITSSKPSPAPVFNPPSVGLGPPPTVIPSSQPSSRTVPTRRVDPSAIYLSAKDSALNVDKAALPFFTFALPSGSPEPSEAVKEAARKRPIQTFNFTIQSPSLPVSFLPAAEKPVQKAAEWTCGLCCLKNPDSAKEQCTICEAPRPGAAPAKTAPPPPMAMPAPPAAGFAFGKPSAPSTSGFTIPKPTVPAGQWKCTTCDLLNPSTATEQCTICESPKPGAAPPKPKAPSAMPAPPSGGFSFGAPAAPASSTGFAIPKPKVVEGQWKCDTCDLQNPSTATEKCTICETPKPGAKPAPAAVPAALPTPPATGFSFGAKPAAPASGGFSFGAKPTPANQWKCSTCDLLNPSTATEKCTICETPKPGAKPAAAGLTVSGPPAPPSGGFSFGGAKAGPPAPPSGGFHFGGAKAGPPAPPSGGFSFGGKPLTASSSAPAAAVPGMPAPPSGGFTFGAPAAPAIAPLLKPTGGAGEWMCGTCGLSNPATAVEQCTICETPK